MGYLCTYSFCISLAELLFRLGVFILLQAALCPKRLAFWSTSGGLLGALLSIEFPFFRGPLVGERSEWEEWEVFWLKDMPHLRVPTLHKYLSIRGWVTTHLTHILGPSSDAIRPACGTVPLIPLWPQYYNYHCVGKSSLSYSNFCVCYCFPLDPWLTLFLFQIWNDSVQLVRM